MKSRQVFGLFWSIPARCHSSPYSPPPRTCATAITSPRSYHANHRGLKNRSIVIEYAPYPTNKVGCEPSSLIPFLKMMDKLPRVNSKQVLRRPSEPAPLTSNSGTGPNFTGNRVNEELQAHS